MQLADELVSNYMEKNPSAESNACKAIENIPVFMKPEGSLPW
jgi:hypothetical protein